MSLLAIDPLIQFDCWLALDFRLQASGFHRLQQTQPVSVTLPTVTLQSGSAPV